MSTEQKLTKSLHDVQDLGEILGEEYKNPTVDDWLGNLAGFARIMTDYSEAMRESRYNEDEIEEILDEFDIEDWRDQFSTEGDFYTGGPRTSEIYSMLNQLTEQGYDTKAEWKTFGDSLARVWLHLPQFYQAHPSSLGTPLPDDYSSDKPFPQFPIPTIEINDSE
jgi:hypothetical protein